MGPFERLFLRFGADVGLVKCEQLPFAVRARQALAESASPHDEVYTPTSPPQWFHGERRDRVLPVIRACPSRCQIISSTGHIVVDEHDGTPTNIVFSSTPNRATILTLGTGDRYSLWLILLPLLTCQPMSAFNNSLCEMLRPSQSPRRRRTTSSQDHTQNETSLQAQTQPQCRLRQTCRAECSTTPLNTSGTDLRCAPKQ